MKVLVQIRSSPALHAAALAAAPAGALTAGVEAAAAGLTLDPEYPPVQVPAARTLSGSHLTSLAQPTTFSFEPQDSTYIVRGTIPDGAAQLGALAAAAAHPDVVGVFSDPVIESCLVCPGSPAVGADA